MKTVAFIFIATLVLIPLALQNRSEAKNPFLQDFVAMAIIALIVTLHYAF